MKKILALVCVLLAFASVAAQAEDDVLKDITIYKHPQTFEAAKQLALQNREERIEMVQSVIACIQAAKNVEELGACQTDEAAAWNKIRLSYCDTDSAFMKAKGGQTAAGTPAPNECERALAAVTGKTYGSGEANAVVDKAQAQ